MNGCNRSPGYSCSAIRAEVMYRKLSERKLKLNTKTRLRTLPFETQIIKRYQTRQSSVEEALIEMCLTEVFCSSTGRYRRMLNIVAGKFRKMNLNRRGKIPRCLHRKEKRYILLLSWKTNISTKAIIRTYPEINS